MRAPFQDLGGRVFGRLTVMPVSHARQNGDRQWTCRCECGLVCSFSGKKLLNGEATQCRKAWCAAAVREKIAALGVGDVDGGSGSPAA